MVNIIIPTYKARETLPRALDSLVSQTKTMFLVTIVQDGDGEDYTDIIIEYTRRGLHITHLNLSDNIGPGLARQFGMDNDNQSDYFMFLDADDMLMPRAIEVLYTEAKKTGADLILSDFYIERSHQPGMVLKCKNAPVTWCHGKIYKAQYLRNNDIRFRSDLRLNEDSYFNLVAANCTTNKCWIEETTYLWRANPNSLTRTGQERDFFIQSWTQYVKGQVWALIKIASIIKTINVNVVAKTLLNIYEHCMKALYLKLDISVVELKQLGQETFFKNSLQTQQFWNTINETLRASTLFDNSLFFFKLRFNDWLVQYVTESAISNNCNNNT